MLPVPVRSIFRNRWWALVWATGICWTAVDIAGGSSAGQPADRAGANGADSVPADGNGTDGGAAADRGRAQLDALVNSIL